MATKELDEDSIGRPPMSGDLIATKNLHVKRVPAQVWRRARRNALDSGVAFGDYVIGLLATCQPTSTVGTAPKPNTP